jgi:hypothetical protein
MTEGDQLRRSGKVPWVAAPLLTLALLLQSGFTPETAAQSPKRESHQAADRWLEFDLPDDATAITAFEVGYFRAGQSDPVYTFEVPRSQVQSTSERTVRVRLSLGDLSPGERFELRVRSIGGERRGSWSDPSGELVVPDPAPARPKPEKRPRTPRAARTAQTELDADPALKHRLTAAFPGVELSKAAVGYQSVRDLAAALYAASNLKIPFKDVRRLTVDERWNLRKAIVTLRPQVDAKAESRKALSQSLQLVKGTSERR